MGRRLREIEKPFVAAGPAGARVRTRLRVSPGDAVVLAAVGSHLGSLASADLAARCAEGRLDAKGRAASRAARKRALTAGASSRWAGAITRTSEDSWQLADRNLRAERASLRSRAAAIGSRLNVPAGPGRVACGDMPPGPSGSPSSSDCRPCGCARPARRSGSRPGG